MRDLRGGAKPLDCGDGSPLPARPRPTVPTTLPGRRAAGRRRTVSGATPALEQAVAAHRAGRDDEAERLYRAILASEPGHALASHNLGALHVQRGDAAAALPFFIAAIEADPARGQYWTSTIDALAQAGQVDDARQMLEMARAQGLEGEEVDALAARLAPPAAPQPAPAPNVTPAAATAASKKPPAAREINAVTALFGQGRLREAEAAALALAQRHPGHPFAWKMLGVVRQQLGDNAGALQPMQRAAQLSPTDAEALANLGIVFAALARPAEAEAAYRHALALDPRFAPAHGNLGAALQAQGRLDEAEASYRRAIALKPDYARAHGNLGAVLLERHRFADAEACFRKALQLQPGNAEAHCNLGTTMMRLGRLLEAEASQRHALALQPDRAETLSNLGATLCQLDRLDESERCLRRARELRPDDADTLIRLGITLKALGRAAEAEGTALQVLGISPDSAHVHAQLGMLLKSLGRIAAAESCLRKALELDPDHVDAHSYLGNLLRDDGRVDEAISHFRRAVAVAPDNPAALGNLAVALMEKFQLTEAEECARRALALNPDSAALHGNLGGVLSHLGRVDEAVASYRQALALDPQNAMSHSNLLFCLSHATNLDSAALLGEHEAFAERFEKPWRTKWPEWTGSRDPERALRVGILSGDLRNHAIAYFIEPVLKGLGAYPALALHAYSNHPGEDAVSLRLRPLFATWRTVDAQSDRELVQTIRDDGIDILVELSGHTARNRLTAVARKPAPLQASWMGYPATTGLTAVDYYLADAMFLPRGRFDEQFSERIVRLPASAPFLPSPLAPAVGPLPARAGSGFCFASFNHLSKLNPAVVAAWAQVLHAVPGARMLIGGLHAGGETDVLAGWFAAAGIPADRLDFRPRCPLADYLRLHHEVDVCLDSFPYGGGTTTLHALWMGVPTLTLAGTTSSGRSGASILGHVGLADFVAADVPDFVRRAQRIAADLDALAAIRAGLRERFTASAMGQPALVAAGLERALRTMWRRWCAGQPAAAFEVTREELA